MTIDTAQVMYEIDGEIVDTHDTEDDTITEHLEAEYGPVSEYPAELTIVTCVVATKRVIDVREFVRENYDEDALRKYDEAHWFDEEDRV